MAINSFTTLKSAVADWLDRDDMDTVIATMIGLMETRLYSALRVRDMETAFSSTISSGTVAVPSDFIEFKYLYISGDPVTALEFKPAQWIVSTYPVRSSDSKPCYAAVDANTVIFGPFPDSDYTVAGTYYARPTALSASNETNFLTTDYPDILLYGTLVQSAPYLGHDSRLPLWETAYSDALDRMMAAERRERFPTGSPLAMVAR